MLGCVLQSVFFTTHPLFLWWGSEARTLPQKLGNFWPFKCFLFCVCWRVVYGCGIVGEHCEVVGEVGWLVGEVCGVVGELSWEQSLIRPFPTSASALTAPHLTSTANSCIEHRSNIGSKITVNSSSLCLLQPAHLIQMGNGHCPLGNHEELTLKMLFIMWDLFLKGVPLKYWK